MIADDRMRLDMLVAQARGCSRAYAAALITSGHVSYGSIVKLKPGEKVKVDLELTITPPETEYVSRGGYKLKKALDCFNISINGKTCMDVGASTGGFTDCLLKSGAKHVYAVDVGTGQLAAALLLDERVIKLPNTDIRRLSTEAIAEKCDFICIDVSFISITKVAENAWRFLSEHGEMVCLIKPQFETQTISTGRLNKKGIVRDKKAHIKILAGVYQYFTEIGENVAGITISPIKGGDGNTEYLLLISKLRPSITQRDYSAIITDMVNRERL